MLTNDEQRELQCNDLGGDSSEEDNEKQNVHSSCSSPPSLVPSARQRLQQPLQQPPLQRQSQSQNAEATSEDDDASSKLLYHPVVVSTLLNIDFENYMVHESQNDGSAKQQRSYPPSASSAILSSLPVRFHEPHREFVIVERSNARPRSASLTDNIECFRTRRDERVRVPVNRSNDDLSGARVGRTPLYPDLCTVTESVNSTAESMAFGAPAAICSATWSRVVAQRSCDLHRRSEASAPSAPVLTLTSSAAEGPAYSGMMHENGVVLPTVAMFSFNCARTASFHALLCSCRLTCCCMCDFLCPAECYDCLHGICSRIIARYPCTRSHILRPVNIAAADKVS